MSKVENGKTVRDKISGYEGVVIARTDWLTGCVRFGVQARKLKEDGGVLDAQWFDESQLEVIDDAGVPNMPGVVEPPPGGPTPTPPRNPDPK